MTSQHDNPKRWQFGLAMLMVAVTGCAIFFGVARVLGLPITAFLCIQPAIFLGLAILYAEWQRRQDTMP